MTTVRTGNVGKSVLRLVERNKSFTGIIISDGAIKSQLTGDNADDVWRRLHDEVDKANPKYFGFDGARNRFLHFFPNGFGSAGYVGDERDYKLKAKAKLDTEAPFKKALTASGLGEAVLAAFRNTNLLSLSRRHDFRPFFAARMRTASYAARRSSPRAIWRSGFPRWSAPSSRTKAPSGPP